MRVGSTTRGAILGDRPLPGVPSSEAALIFSSALASQLVSPVPGSVFPLPVVDTQLSSFPFLFAFAVGGLGFEFCVFVAGWGHALRSE